MGRTGSAMLQVHTVREVYSLTSTRPSDDLGGHAGHEAQPMQYGTPKNMFGHVQKISRKKREVRKSRVPAEWRHSRVIICSSSHTLDLRCSSALCSS